MLADRTIQRHEIYRHYKGGLYTILELPINTESNEVMVVYAGVTGLWVRSLLDFVSVLGDADSGYFYKFEQVQHSPEESGYAT